MTRASLERRVGSTRPRAALALAALAGLAAGCVETGSHVTLTAPDGPSNAEAFAVVLATPEQVPMIGEQRLEPGHGGTRSVHYFLQRTVAGAEASRIDDVDGFTMRIAPESSIDESEFIPFVILYDGNGRITGIATYRAGEPSMPAPMRIVRDEISKYQLQVERVREVEDDVGRLEPGDVRVVTCYGDDQSAVPSGLVWHTAAGHEYRLLFPVDGGMDATGRELDMDCDAHAVTIESSRADCDDTRSAFHRDAAEVCDGMDTNCDHAQVIASECQSTVQCNSSPFGATGVALCDDTIGEETACQATASCACANDSCAMCKIPVARAIVNESDPSWVKPCYAAYGSLYTRGLCTEVTPCDIAVVGVRGGWKFEISAPEANTYGLHAHDITGNIDVKAKRGEDPATYEVMAAPSDPVADVDLAIRNATGTHYVPVQLRLGDELALACPAEPIMTCY